MRLVIPTPPDALAFVAIGFLLGLSLYSYHLQELLVCWLCFSVVFVSLALVILTVVLVCYATECLLAWASRAEGVIIQVARGTPELQVKIIQAGGKLE
jgi:hypothetical protein